MRIYFYDAATGIYQGEDFEVEEAVHHEDGITTVKPPPYGKGEIPVYDPRERQWRLKAVGEVSFEESGRSEAIADEARTLYFVPMCARISLEKCAPCDERKE